MRRSSAFRPNVPISEKIGTKVGTGRVAVIEINGLSIFVPTSQSLASARTCERAWERARARACAYMKKYIGTVGTLGRMQSNQLVKSSQSRPNLKWGLGRIIGGSNANSR